VLLEETNARYLNSLPEQPALAVFDLSFISLLTVLPAILRLLDPAATLITLIKPQFEASPKLVGKGGIVRSPQVRRDVVDSVLSGMAALGVTPLGLTASPIRGSAGNAEYLAYATLSPQREPPTGASLLASVAWD
jgi:23S rRNA (cytidine1920-2'-O)/16S rRNA (cytidine1409-2'-O)-methyltransferase